LFRLLSVLATTARCQRDKAKVTTTAHPKTPKLDKERQDDDERGGMGFWDTVNKGTDARSAGYSKCYSLCFKLVTFSSCPELSVPIIQLNDYKNSNLFS